MFFQNYPDTDGGKNLSHSRFEMKFLDDITLRNNKTANLRYGVSFGVVLRCQKQKNTKITSPNLWHKNYNVDFLPKFKLYEK